jgi:hypothetical protein
VVTVDRDLRLMLRPKSDIDECSDRSSHVFFDPDGDVRITIGASTLAWNIQVSTQSCVLTSDTVRFGDIAAVIVKSECRKEIFVSKNADSS